MHGAGMSADRAQASAGLGAPPAEVRLQAGADDGFSVGTESDGQDILVAVAEGEDADAAFGIDKADGAVLAAGGEPLAVRRPGDGGDEVGVRGENAVGLSA